LQGGTWINILDHVSMGPNRGIYLVDIGGKVLVLGITDHNMVKIMEIEDDANNCRNETIPEQLR
jgi:flagellar biogenesis protein FliO